MKEIITGKVKHDYLNKTIVIENKELGEKIDINAFLEKNFEGMTVEIILHIDDTTAPGPGKYN